MKILSALLLLLVCVVANGQERRFNPDQYDFSQVDVTKFDEKKTRCTIDSLYIVTGIDSLHALLNYVQEERAKEGRDYGAFVIGLELAKMSVKSLNKELKANGLDQLPETFGALNMGMDVMTDRWLVSWMTNIKIKERIQNEDVKISFASSAMISMSFGYDMVNLKRIQLYPILGLSYQKFSMEVRRKDLERGQDLQYYLDNAYESTFKKRLLAGVAGAELDVHLFKPKTESPGVILVVRAGFQKTLIDGKLWMHHGGFKVEDGNAGRESFLSVGFKFFAYN